MGRLILFILAFAAVSPYHGGNCQLVTIDLANFFQALYDFLLNFFFRPPPTFPPTTTPPLTTTTPTTSTTTTPTTTVVVTTRPPTTSTTTPTTTTTTTRPTTTSTTTPTTTTTTTRPTTTTTAAPKTCGQGTRSLDTRIVGGTNAKPGMWPWQVALKAWLTGSISSVFCGGSLISTKHVLTAAHCTAGKNAGNIFVRMNEVDFNNQIETVYYDFSVLAIRQHPQYAAGSEYNDISILLINGVAPVGVPYVGVVCLADFDLAEGTQVYVSGWGTTTQGGNVSPILQDAPLYIVSNANCAKAYASYGPTAIISSMLCASDTGKDTCQGDSGGPLVVKVGGAWRLAGITSWGEGCAQPNFPGVYTRVSSFVPWIKANTQEATVQI